jgi:hypothetical protein
MNAIHRLWDMIGEFALCTVLAFAAGHFIWACGHGFGKRKPLKPAEWECPSTLFPRRQTDSPALWGMDRTWPSTKQVAKWYASVAGIGAAIGIALWLISLVAPNYP